MKRLLFFICVLIISTTLSAQKVYSTKSGKISFESKAPLEDIEAINSEVESKLLPSNGQIVFSLLIKGFQFENQLMEEHFNEDYMESSKYPKSTFKGFITNIKEINLTKDGTYPAKVKGSLSIHGVTKEVTSNGTITINKGTVRAKSTFDIKLKTYNIGGSMIGKKIAENIAITVDCVYK